MAARASVCSALLKRSRSKDDVILRLVTVDETWIHYYEPENKLSRQWVGPGSPRPKKYTTICRQGEGQSILARKRRYYVGLFNQEKYNSLDVLCKLARPAEIRHP